MRHRMDHKRLGRYGSARAAMLSNMTASLFLHGQIKTTITRAKEVRRVAEKLITRARGGSVHDRRIVRARMPHKEAILRLFGTLAPRYASFDKGGYTRIVKLGSRVGDGAPMAVLQLIERQAPESRS